MTGYIPDSFIQGLVARVDLVELIRERIPLRKAGNNFVACCPFHQEKTPSFSVNSTKQFYHCFGCGVHGDALQFLMEMNGFSFVEAVQALADREGLTVPTENTKAQNDKTQTWYDCLEKAAQFFQKQLYEGNHAASVISYLKSRGITKKTALHFGLGFSPFDRDLLYRTLVDKTDVKDWITAGLLFEKETGAILDRFRGRLMCPIRDQRGRVIGFGGRLIEEGQPKYLNSPETPLFSKSRELYGLYEARQVHRQLASLIVVEGYLDVIMCHQSGVQNAVATLGTALTEKHIDVLWRYTSEIIFCFDGDHAGREAAKRALQLVLPSMTEGRRVRFVFLPEREDPDSFLRHRGRDAFLHYLEQGIPLSDFFFSTLSVGIDLRQMDGRAQLAALAKPLLAKLPKGVFQKMMSERLAHFIGVDARWVGAGEHMPKGRLPLKSAAPPPPPKSPVVYALTLILHHPDLAEWVVEPTRFRSLYMPHIALFVQIVELFRKSPTLSLRDLLLSLPEDADTEGVIQEAYNNPWVHTVPLEGVEQEFRGAIQRLEERIHEQVLETLLAKAKRNQLSAEEKQQLQQLLMQRR